MEFKLNDGVNDFTLKINNTDKKPQLIVYFNEEMYFLDLILEELEKEDVRFERYDTIEELVNDIVEICSSKLEDEDVEL